MAHHNNNSCSINLEETLVKENIPTRREEILRNDPTIVNKGQKVMFEKSGLTINDVMEMVVGFSIRFGSTNQQREWLLEMLKVCAGSSFKDVKLSNYKVSKLCNTPSDKIVYHFYCDNYEKKDSVLYSGFKKEVKGQRKICSKCDKEHSIVLSNTNFFLSIDLEY
ncbi:uncharacterized protein LOC122505314 [Leptopilina heterotoma]|uniref:uncharacterized protein LOC122505314 n=1 Tax=Leptopilina heterotoma TaxID=63436 RepID=UPI001CAA03D0|nr:uncharacterized protein LOC122505314 [Leptopilina heterotoma]